MLYFAISCHTELSQESEVSIKSKREFTHYKAWIFYLKFEVCLKFCGYFAKGSVWQDLAVWQMTLFKKPFKNLKVFGIFQILLKFFEFLGFFFGFLNFGENFWIFAWIFWNVLKIFKFVWLNLANFVNFMLNLWKIFWICVCKINNFAKLSKS